MACPAYFVNPRSSALLNKQYHPWPFVVPVKFQESPHSILLSIYGDPVTWNRISRIWPRRELLNDFQTLHRARDTAAHSEWDVVPDLPVLTSGEFLYKSGDTAKAHKHIFWVDPSLKLSVLCRRWPLVTPAAWVYRKLKFKFKEAQMPVRQFLQKFRLTILHSSFLAKLTTTVEIYLGMSYHSISYMEKEPFKIISAAPSSPWTMPPNSNSPYE